MRISRQFPGEYKKSKEQLISHLLEAIASYISEVLAQQKLISQDCEVLRQCNHTSDVTYANEIIVIVTKMRAEIT
jgi:predicted metal-binding protein